MEWRVQAVVEVVEWSLCYKVELDYIYFIEESLRSRSIDKEEFSRVCKRIIPVNKTNTRFDLGEQIF